MKKSHAVFFLTGVIICIFLIIVFGSFFTVDQGERAVVLRNGEIIRVAEPGLEWKTPIIEDARMISVRDQTVSIPMEAYSFDQQPATLQVSVTFRVPTDRVADLYTEYGTLQNLSVRVIERRVPDAVKNTFGKFTAVRAIQEREQLGIDSLESVKSSMRDAPIQIIGLQIEEVGFSDVYEKSIEQRMLAQVQIETTRQKKQTAQIQAEIQVVQAQAEANSQRERFQAEADGIRLRGEAEAFAIEARAKALASNSNLVNLIGVEKWDGKLPQTQVPGSALPFIGIK